MVNRHFKPSAMRMAEASIRFGIPPFIEKTMSVHSVGNRNMYIRYYTLLWVDVEELVSETHEDVAWCYRITNGKEIGPFRTFDIPFNGQGQLDPQCPDGQVPDPGMSDNESMSSDGVPVEYEVDEAEPMDLKQDEDEFEQFMEEDPEIEDPEIDGESEEAEAELDSLDSDEGQSYSFSSLKSSGFDSDWVP